MKITCWDHENYMLGPTYTRVTISKVNQHPQRHDLCILGHPLVFRLQQLSHYPQSQRPHGNLFRVQHCLQQESHRGLEMLRPVALLWKGSSLREYSLQCRLLLFRAAEGRDD